MFEKQSYDSPPMYSPPSNHYGPQDSFLPPQSDFDPYPPPPGSYYIGEEVPQHFYKWTSPPGIIKIMECAIVVLCLGIFACVASTLVWDMQYGAGYGLGSGYGMGSYGSNYYGSGHYGSGYYGSGYYGGYNQVSPYSAKSAMIAMAAINFIVALAIFVATFSKTQTVRSRKFYLVVLVCSAILAALQGIINIVYIVGVNPMAQSSANAFYNPMLMMCQSLYGNSVTGMGGGFPLYNQYLYHYCYVDPQEAVAMVCGFLVVIALVVAGVFSYKTRSRIWRYGKQNVYWDEPLTGGTEGRDVEDWVNNMGDGQSFQEASVMFSEKGAPPLNKSQSVTSIPFKSDPCIPPAYSERCVFSGGQDPESSSPSEKTERKPAALRGKRRRKNPELDESQYETEYTTGGENGNELDPSYWISCYPEISSSSQRQDYKREFDSDLRTYKQLCAEIDDINDELNKLSRELDTLNEGTNKYQAVAEEFNRLKDLKQTPKHQEKKQRCRRLRHKLFHIKHMVKEYDRAQS